VVNNRNKVIVISAIFGLLIGLDRMAYAFGCKELEKGADILMVIVPSETLCYNTRTQYKGTSFINGYFDVVGYDVNAPEFLKFKVTKWINVIEQFGTNSWGHYEYCIRAMPQAPEGSFVIRVRFEDQFARSEEKTFRVLVKPTQPSLWGWATVCSVPGVIVNRDKDPFDDGQSINEESRKNK